LKESLTDFRAVREKGNNAQLVFNGGEWDDPSVKNNREGRNLLTKKSGKSVRNDMQPRRTGRTWLMKRKGIRKKRHKMSKEREEKSLAIHEAYARHQ